LCKYQCQQDQARKYDSKMGGNSELNLLKMIGEILDTYENTEGKPP